MAKKTKNYRGYSRRKTNTRELRIRFLIVCEGTKTEPNYFNSFRVPKNVVEIDVRGVGKDPSQLVDDAKKIRDNDDYDRIWCVFDRDSWTPENFNNAISSAKSQGFEVAYSNEAFELWYILHFEYLNTATSRKDYGDKLSNHLEKPYKKNDPTIYDELLPRQETAIKNAKKLLNQYDRHDPANNNPATTVHLLVESLNECST